MSLAAAAIVVVLIAGAAALAAHRVTSRRMQRRARAANASAGTLIERWRRNATLEGAVALSAGPSGGAPALADLAACYYTPPDFARVTWVGRDVPTPFVGCGSMPGTIAGGSINAMQFRYDREIAVPKPRDTVRVFVVGGSTAFGAGASGNATTAGGYLEQYLNDALAPERRAEVVTAAACAWTSTHERIVIENRLVELQPDLVVALSGHNDAFWASRGRNVLWTRVFQDDYFFTLVNAALAANGEEPFSTADPGATDTVSPADAARRLARNVAWSHHALASAGADYLFALQPVLKLSRKALTPRERLLAAQEGAQHWYAGMPAYYEEFRHALAALDAPGLHVADATAIFDAAGDDVDLFVDSCHFGDRGYDAIARWLCARVVPILDARRAVAVD
ncbi:MAG TPA: SGNH/GDSL hydrolase family protein [Candidatus Elarobacter sp.]|jgi:lysophospholipase L1-like esterase|nr:SGNH/GDSL hydrolase family protein [Candidatus Elarobacter sp.]